MMVPRVARVSCRLITALAFIAGAVSVSAQAPQPETTVVPPAAGQIELPHIDVPSLDGKTMLFGHLFRPKEDHDVPRPAVVMMHGCSGLLAKNGRFFPLYRPWVRALLEKRYVVLVIDSTTPRGFGQTCSPASAAEIMWRERPKDAYAALLYLQAQPFVQADHVGLIGWSQGGGAVLIAINEHTTGRMSDESRTAAARLQHDFVAAVAFYPGACSERFQQFTYPPGEQDGWTSRVPLLVLFGEADVWTELKPCAAFLDAAKARGNPIELKTYPDAVHAFDAPNLKRTELPQYRTNDGRIPVIGTDSAARDDVFVRVPEFLEKHLGH